MSKKMHVIEAFGHTELLFRWSKAWSLIDGLTVECHVNVQYRETLAGHFEPFSNVSVSGPGKGISWKKYIADDLIGEEDIVLLTTLGRWGGWGSALNQMRNLYVVVHNANYCFESTAGLSWRSLRSRVKNMIDSRARRGILKALKGVIVPIPEMKAFIREKRGNDLYVQVVPFSYQVSSLAAEQANGKRTYIVIPGTVNNKTRNYHSLIHALRIASGKGLVADVVLAGELKEEALIDAFRLHFPVQEEVASMPESNNSIKVFFFRRLLSQREYESIIGKASFIVAPVKKEVRFGSQIEVIGRTKVSGSLFDALYHMKPILIPSNVDITFPGHHPYISASDLAEKMIWLAENRSAVEVDQAYSLSAAVDKWTSLIDGELSDKNLKR